MDNANLLVRFFLLASPIPFKIYWCHSCKLDEFHLFVLHPEQKLHAGFYLIMKVTC